METEHETPSQVRGFSNITTVPTVLCLFYHALRRGKRLYFTTRMDYNSVGCTDGVAASRMPANTERAASERGFDLRHHEERGFTLVELMVVMAIISLLMSILLPALGKAREQARRTVCLANLRSVGQGLYVYANENNGALVPGDSAVPWDVWAQVTEGPRCGVDMDYRQVNLGHLLHTNVLPIPSDDDNVLFCPSIRSAGGGNAADGFRSAWNSPGTEASITYMYNTSLDGFGKHVIESENAVLAHKDKINYLMSDGSVGTFNVQALVYDSGGDAEMIDEVCRRYGVCFPTALMHRWLEKGEIDVREAEQFLNDPYGWMVANASNGAGDAVSVSSVANRVLASDVVGVWGGTGSRPTAPPPG